MTQPNFVSLPTVPSPEWLPKQLIAKRKLLDTALTTVETKRQEVLDALRNARSQDLGSFEIVRVDVLPALQQEFRFRQEFADYVAAVLAEARTYEQQCSEAVSTAEEAIKGRLIDMGYDEPVNGVAARGCYPPDSVPRHPHVLAAKGKVDEIGSFIAAQTQVRHQNNRDVEALKLRLQAMRDAAVLAV